MATPLSEAWLRFSDSKLRGQYEEPSGTDGVGPIDFEKGFWDTAHAVIGHLSKAVQAEEESSGSPKRESAIFSYMMKMTPGGFVSARGLLLKC